MQPRMKYQAHKASNQKFGWLFSVIFSVSFFYFHIKHSALFAAIAIFLAAFFVLTTLLKPSMLTPLNRAWFALSLFLGRVFSPIVLSLVFFILIAPVSLVTRFFGRDALFLKRRQVSTYWVDKESIEPESFKNQF
jgi:hypothetical protein